MQNKNRIIKLESFSFETSYSGDSDSDEIDELIRINKEEKEVINIVTMDQNINESRQYLDYNKIRHKDWYNGTIEITCYSGWGITGYLCPNPRNEQICYYCKIQSEKDNWRVGHILLTLTDFNDSENWIK